MAAAPPGSEAMQGCLLTSLLVEAAAAAAIERHSWQRGRIEACFRMGKADCPVERLACRTADRPPRLDRDQPRDRVASDGEDAAGPARA